MQGRRNLKVFKLIYDSFVFHKDCTLFERRARYRIFPSSLPKSIQSKYPLCLAEDILPVLKPLRLLCSPAELVYSKLTTTIVSTFTSHYVFLWPTYFPSTPLTPPLPSFDGRSVLYPSVINLRDYMSWRQVDCM